MRALWLFAVGVLALDAILLAVAGWWSGSVALFGWAAGCAAAAGVVGWSWRWYRRRLDDLARARRELAQQARSLADDVRQRRPSE